MATDLISLTDFVSKYPVGSRIDTDGYPPEQPYQCVDPIKAYLNQVFGLPLQSWGSSAAAYWTNATLLQYFDQITDGSKEQGDILVWGQGAITGEAGHIAIWDNGQLYNQNYNDSGRISLNAFFSSGYKGTLRIKGGTMVNFTEEQIQVMAIMATGSIPGDNYNYPETKIEINSANLDVTLQTWQSRVSIITPELESMFAIMATGSTYGKDYNSPYQGKPTLTDLIPCAQFWVEQRVGTAPDTETVLKPGEYKVI